MGLVIGLIMLGLIFFMVKPTLPTFNLNKLKPSSKTKKIIKYSLAVLGAMYGIGLLVLIGVAIAYSFTHKDEDITQDTPGLIECYINGTKVMASRENCASLSKKDTPAKITTPTKPVTNTQTVAPQPTQQPEKKTLAVQTKHDDSPGTHYCYEGTIDAIRSWDNTCGISIWAYNSCKDYSSTKKGMCSDNCGYDSSSCMDSCWGLGQDCYDKCLSTQETCVDGCYSHEYCETESKRMKNDCETLQMKIEEYCP